MSAARCPRAHCGQLLVDVTDGMGHLALVCPACARNRRGLCRDCPRPLAKRNALRCPPCARARTLANRRDYSRRVYQDPERRTRKLAQQAEYKRRPAVRARHEAYKRAWLEREPGYMTFATKKWRASPKGRAATRAANRRWRERHPEQARAIWRRYYETHREALCAKERERQRRKREARAAQGGQERAA